MQKVLIVSGPTATGKTGFALDLCRRIPAEIVSADSRQVYKGMDIVTGKDVPAGAEFISSSLKVSGFDLGYYQTPETRIWLYDLVSPDAAFTLSHWSDLARKIIADISSRGRLPIVVGGTGLYIKSLISNLSDVSFPRNDDLRQRLSGRSVSDLQAILSGLNPDKFAGLNPSDRSNPRRLLRAIEVSQASSSADCVPSSPEYDFLIIGLTASKEILFARTDTRIAQRIAAGAEAEARKLISVYPPDLPSMTGCGYRAFLSSDWLSEWSRRERNYIKRQLTWFKKQPHTSWFDISSSDWKVLAEKSVSDWYNKPA